MEGAEKKGFVCDSGRKPTDYNHASAYRATKVPDIRYIQRDNWDFFSFSFFLVFHFSITSLFAMCTSIFFWLTHRKKKLRNLKRIARVNECTRDVYLVYFRGMNRVRLFRKMIRKDELFMSYNIPRSMPFFVLIMIFLLGPTYGWPVPLRSVRIIVAYNRIYLPDDIRMYIKVLRLLSFDNLEIYQTAYFFF